MRPKDEQIAVLLNQNHIADWAKEQIPSSASLDDFRYEDFFEVNPDEVTAFVLKNGFNSSAVWVEGLSDPARNDCFCIETCVSGWNVFYEERGEASQHAIFATFEESVAEVVLRLMQSAYITLSHGYWHKHYSHLNQLPDFGGFWPKKEPS